MAALALIVALLLLAGFAIYVWNSIQEESERIQRQREQADLVQHYQQVQLQVAYERARVAADLVAQKQELEYDLAWERLRQLRGGGR